MGETPSPTDSGELARYVSAEALRGFNFREPITGLPGQAIAEHLYDELARMRIGHIGEAARSVAAWAGATQQIQAPHDIQRAKAATALDVSVLYASLVHSAGLGPVLAIGRDLEHDDVRAIVLVLLDEDDSIGSSVRRQMGIATADGLTEARITAGSLVAVDVAAVLMSPDLPEPARFEIARRRGDDFVRSMITWGEPLHLVNVRVREQLADHRPHMPNRDDDTFLPMSLPPHAAHVALFAEQRRAVEELRRGNGTMVLVGPGGSGKTTAALHLAADQVNGPAWFLDASSPDSLVSSLAEIAVREQGLPVDQLDPVDRRGYADSMLARANRSSNPWFVVADNADGDPAAILGLLPRPVADHRQSLIVTTTNREWRAVPTIDAYVTLGPVEAAEAERALNAYDDLNDLVNGRVLVLEAYSRYLATGRPAADLRRHAGGSDADGDLRGIVALVGAVLEQRPDLHEELGRLSLLPADRLPHGERDDLLATYGLLDLDPVTHAPRMHRLVALGVQHVLGKDTLARVALRMMNDIDDWSALSIAADPALLDRLADLLLESPVAGNGLMLAAAAGLMELRGRVQLSWRLASHAQSDFDGSEEDLPVEYADILQCLARYTNQQRSRDLEAIEEGIAQVALAQRISERHGDARRLRRARRLEALLLMKRARLEPDLDQRVVGIAEALSALERAAADAETAGDPAETARALFNLAGPYIELAQLVPERADEHLGRAAEIYERVRDGRVRLYRQALHPHVAACVAGLALVRYLEALLVGRSLPRRQALLAEATEHGVQALDDRFALEGLLGGADTAKSARLLTKIAYARQVLNEDHPSGDVLAEAAQETVVRLTADMSSAEFVERWCGSPALADLLGHSSTESFETTLMLARGLADDNRRDDADPRTVLVAARHLGLMDVELPARRIFSLALVLDRDDASSGAGWPTLRRHLAEGRLAAERLIVVGASEPVEGVESGTRVHVVDRDVPIESLARFVMESARDQHVLLVTRDLRRLRVLSRLRNALPEHRVEALGVRARRPTPAEYRYEIGATAAALEAWWQTGRR